MCAISAAIAARSTSAAGAGPTNFSRRLLAASQSPSASSSPSPSGSPPLWARPGPEAAPAATEEAASAAAEEEVAGEAAAPQEAAAEAAAASAPLVAAPAGVAVASVQVQHYLHACTKKSRDLVAVQARFNPGKWDMTGGGDEMLHGIVVAVYARGVEVYDLAGTNASKSTCVKFRGCCSYPTHQPPALHSRKLFIYCSTGGAMAPATPHDKVG